MRLAAKGSENKEFKMTTPMPEESKINMDGWLNVSEFSWNKLYVVVRQYHVYFFKLLDKKQRTEPVLVLDIASIQNAKNFTDGEFQELGRSGRSGISSVDNYQEIWTRNLSNIFVLTYDVQGEVVYEAFLDAEKITSEYLEYKGHVFQDVQYRTPTICHACEISMWNMLHPPPAFKCTICDIKTHKKHYDKDDGSIKSCPRIPIAKHADVGFNLRKLLLEAESPDQKDAWITHINGRIKQFKHH